MKLSMVLSMFSDIIHELNLFYGFLMLWEDELQHHHKFQTKPVEDPFSQDSLKCVYGPIVLEVMSLL